MPRHQRHQSRHRGQMRPRLRGDGGRGRESDRRHTLDGNNPNNCWGQSEESGEIVGGAWIEAVGGNAVKL